ncbi:MAG: hypothetical protein LBP51_01955 [Deferribacteraceae bacterium]|jgi:hypothetical protein|nr:hypothetical protein [Deferribacteraceae bacterium]
MKNSLIYIFAVSLIFVSVSAFAWGHFGKEGHFGKDSRQPCPCPNSSNLSEGGIGADINSFTAEDAANALEQELKPAYKGYTFGEIETKSAPDGFNIYSVRAVDSSGNNFVFFFGARGKVIGPILESNLPKRFMER